MYLDANVIVYAVTQDRRYGAPGARWLKRIEAKEVPAESSVLMIVECLHAFRSLNRILARKRRAPIDIPGSIRAILSLQVRWLELTPTVVARASELTQPMTAGDAVHVASMELHGVSEILSADQDFDRIANIRRIDPLARS